MLLFFLGSHFLFCSYLVRQCVVNKTISRRCERHCLLHSGFLNYFQNFMNLILFNIFQGNTKEEENISIHEIELFIGNNQKKKPPTR